MRVTVADTSPPVVTISGDALHVLTLPRGDAPGAVIDVSGQATASDTCDEAPTVANDAPAVFPPGRTVVTFTARDAAGNRSTASVEVQVGYRFGGVRPPPAADGSSVFTAGRTIPVKFRLQAADGTTVPSARATLRAARLVDPASGRTEPVGAAQAFRFDLDDGEYITQFRTKGFQPAKYVLTIALNDGSSHDVVVTLRRPDEGK
jgi:HYR domain